jgi:hypothetical protein
MNGQIQVHSSFDVDDFTLDTATAEFHNILFGDPTAMEL